MLAGSDGLSWASSEWIIRVSTGPGQTASTRIPWRATSTAAHASYHRRSHRRRPATGRRGVSGGVDGDRGRARWHSPAVSCKDRCRRERERRTPTLGILRTPPSGLPANRSNMETISARDAGYDASPRPSSAARQEIALYPNLPRNHRENALESENPSTYATSLKDRPRSLT